MLPVTVTSGVLQGFQKRQVANFRDAATGIFGSQKGWVFKNGSEWINGWTKSVTPSASEHFEKS